MKWAAMILFHAAAGVSGVLFLFAVGLWAASYGWRYSLTRVRVSTSRMVIVSRGELAVQWVWFPGGFGRGMVTPQGWHGEMGPALDLIQSFALYFGAGRQPVAGFFFGRLPAFSVSGTLLLLPIPFLMFLFAPLPLVEVMLIPGRRRRKRDAMKGMCARCGYDLRATPTKCPECGTVPTAQAGRLAGPDG